MTSPRNIESVRTRKPITADARTGALPTRKPASEPLPVRTVNLEVPTPQQPADRWIVALTVAGLCVLAGVLATYLLHPAMSTLIDASVGTWSGEGP